MSHFSKIQTSLKDLDLLKKSLNDLSIHWEPELNKLEVIKIKQHLQISLLNKIIIMILVLVGMVLSINL